MPDYFEFEVELRDAKPRVWRRFMVPKKGTFLDLHQAIQDACGWLDYHLFNFFQKRSYGESLAGIPDEDGFDEYPVPDASRQKLSAFFGTGKGKKKTCGYLYDFGDDWIHKVTLKGTRELADEFPRRLLAGERAFPREDCGGMGGYERSVEFAKTGKDPWDEDGDDGEELAEWLDGWHPDSFDLEAVKKQFDLGRDEREGFGPGFGVEEEMQGEDVEAYYDKLAESPVEMLKASILGSVAARGSTEPWTSIISCTPPLGEAGCDGHFQIWQQEVPSGAGYRCKSCGAQGSITSLLGDDIELPPPREKNMQDLARVSVTLEQFYPLTESDIRDLSIIVGAGYEGGEVVMVGELEEFAILCGSLSAEAKRSRGTKRKMLGELVKRVEESLS